MRKFAVLLSLLLLPFASMATSILLTGFKPFGNRSINTSFEVVKVLQKSLSFQGHEVHICEIPVEYSRAFETAKGCLQALNQRPELVISFGEKSGSAELNKTARNYAGYVQDEEGTTWGGRQISVDLPNEIELSMKVPQLFCAVSKTQRSQVSIAQNPGAFLCNYVAFKMADYLKATQTPYTFIHVPSLGSYQKSALQDLAAILEKMILAQLQQEPGAADPELQQCLADASKR